MSETPRVSPWWRRAPRYAVEAGLSLAGLQDRIFWRLPAGANSVALTFDDGPHPEYTPRVLDILAEAGVRATFFVVGREAARYPELVRRIQAEGHGIGNHTFSHASCRKLSPAEVRREIEATDEILTDLGILQTGLFRPPWGALRVSDTADLLRRGRRIAFWTRDSRDYREASAEAIAALGGDLRPREILLLHDRFPNPVAALPGLLRALAERKLAAVSLSSPEKRRGRKQAPRREPGRSVLAG
jgi:peptidoglycan/xylan/chitin deacetylase (PgdA/CDA1 family)